METDGLEGLLKGINPEGNEENSGEGSGEASMKIVTGREGLMKLMKVLGMEKDEDEEEEEREEATRVKAKPEWMKIYKELGQIADDSKALLLKARRKHKLLWSTIQEELNDDRSMKLDEEKGEIIIFKDED